MELGALDGVSKLIVYQYEHLDDLSFTRSPEQVWTDSSPDEIADYVNAVSEMLRIAGWEGDGYLSILWIPPFVDNGIEDTWGTYVWAVKQSNNGTTWLASAVPLDLPR